MKRKPFGIIFGSCAIFVFYATIGLIAAYIVEDGVMKQTASRASFLGSWWQILLFIVDILVLALGVYSLVMFFIQRNKLKEVQNDE